MFLALLNLSIACVERYYPDERDLTSGTLVINAHITDEPGNQVIEISRSSTLNYRDHSPESGCYAVLLREDSESMEFYETKPGKYVSELDEAFLQTGMSFQVQVITPDGNEYHSDFDRLRPVPEIDSIYYQVETMSYQSAGVSVSGIWFYMMLTY